MWESTACVLFLNVARTYEGQKYSFKLVNVKFENYVVCLFV